MQGTAPSLPRLQLCQLLLEFWEAAVHTILYARGLYQPQLFVRERLFRLAVHRARHPALISYIASALSELKVLRPLASCSCIDMQARSVLERAWREQAFIGCPACSNHPPPFAGGAGPWEPAASDPRHLHSHGA